MELKAVVFDVDGTLYSQWELLRCSLGFYIRNFHFVSDYMRIRRRLRDSQLWYEAGNREDLCRKQAEMYAETRGIPVLEAGVLLQEKIYIAWEKTFKNVRPFRYVPEVLKSLRKRGYIVGAMSDFPVRKKLRYIGLENCWDYAFTSEESGYLKPHGAAFRYLVGKLSLDPNQILYVGNHYHYDIEGAKNAGLWTGYFGSRRRENPAADFTFSRYKNFFQAFDRFISEHS